MINSTVRREWDPCKICAYLDNENFENTCKECEETKTEDHPSFYPANDFQQFLKKNNYKLDISQNRFDFEVCPIIILSDSLDIIDKNINLFNDFYNIDKEYYKINIHDTIEELKNSYKLHTIYILSIDKETRNAIYNDEFIMKHYLIYLLYDDSDKRKSLKYKLDKRFYHIAI